MDTSRINSIINTLYTESLGLYTDRTFRDESLTGRFHPRRSFSLQHQIFGRQMMNLKLPTGSKVVSCFTPIIPIIPNISPALQPNSKRTICDWQRLGPAAWISDRVLPTWFPESINRPHIKAGVLKISRGTDNVKSSCTHRHSTRKRT